jgi:hypothetical protein
MKVEAHLDKFERFEAYRRQFDPLEDFELWYWSLLSAGTTLINAALHVNGITRAEDAFATQVPDVYAVPDAAGWRYELRYLTDLIHVGMPKLDVTLPAALRTAFHEMEIIERYRDPCVRSNQAVTAEVVDTIAAAYRRCIEATRQALAPARAAS